MRLARLLLLIAGCAVLAPAQKYTGPRPPKPDIPYLLHASKLVETDVTEAKEEKRKDDQAYVVDGVAATAKTPLAEPILLVETKKLVPDKLQLYRLEVRNGKREIVFSAKRRKDGPRPLYMSVERLAEGLYKLEANETLANGEYSITPEGSNQVFCFQVY